MGKIFLVLVIFIIFVPLLIAIPVEAIPTQSEINRAIEDGLAWLASTQNSDGSWGNGDYVLGNTAAAVLAFENEGHFPDGGTMYSPNVELALDFIFYNAVIATPLPVQMAGNPDTDNDGQGVYFSYLISDYAVYETGLCVMAIIASNVRDRVVTTGSCYGWMYFDVISDVIDWWAYGQVDVNIDNITEQIIYPTEIGRGGWDYVAHDNMGGRSDNSISQWPVLGMMAAEQWGINAPPWVKTELEYWVNYIQQYDGGSGYTMPDDWVNIAKTGGLLSQMYWLGDRVAMPASTQVNSAPVRTQNAIDYISWNWNIDFLETHKGDPYVMFAIYKGLSLMDIETLPYVAPDGNWWGDYCQYIINNQLATGQWDDLTGIYGEWLTTSWYIVMLQATILPVGVVVELPECVFENTGYNVKVPYSVARFEATGWLKLYKDDVLVTTVPIVHFQGSDIYIHSVTSDTPGLHVWEAELNAATADGANANARSMASLNVRESPQVGNIPDQFGYFTRFDLDDYLTYSGNLPVIWSVFAPPNWVVIINRNNVVTVIAPPNINAATPATAIITFTATVTCGPGVISSDSDDAVFTATLNTTMSDLVKIKGVIRPKETHIIPGIWIQPGMNFMTLAVHWQGSDIDLIAISPDDERVDRDWIADNPDSGITYSEDDTSVEIVVPEPVSGEWQAEIVGTDIPEGGEAYSFEAEVVSPIFVEFASEFKSRYSVDEPINIGVYMAEGEPDTGLFSIPGASVESTIIRPNNGKEQLILYDDGTHDDGLPDDGVYANNYLATDMKGTYSILVLAQKTLNEGEPDEQEIYRRLTASVEVDDAFHISELIPEPDSEVRNIPTPEISAVVQGPAVYIDTIELTLDGNIVAHNHSFVSQIVSYTPDELLLPGVHAVTLRVTDIDGYSVEAPPWSFISVYDPISIDADSRIPEPGSTVPSHILTPTISGTILGPELNIDKASIMLTIDGVKVVHSYDADTQTISYIPPDMLPEGKHIVTLSVKHILGNSVAQTWSFNTVAPLMLQQASYYILDTTLRLELNRGVKLNKICFPGIGMEIGNSGEWDMQLANEQKPQARIDPDDPNAVLIDINRAVPATISLVVASFVTYKSNNIDLLLSSEAFMDEYNGKNLPADIPLKIMADGFALGKRGDVSGDDELTPYDATLILQSTIQGQIIFPIYEAASEVSGLLAAYGYSSDVIMDTADVSGNGVISSYDAALVLQQSILLSPRSRRPDIGNLVSSGRIYASQSNRSRTCRLNVENNPAEVGPPQVRVSVDLDDVRHVYSADIVVTYNPQALTLIDVSNGSSQWLLEQEDSMGQLRISMAGASEPDANTPLVTLTFDVDRHAGLSLQDELRIIELKLNDGILKCAIENLPKNSILLQNYPNPFNPETWIPYRLSEAADVTITIYNMSGQTVRQLELGSKMPGSYIDRSRAAYWDGRNRSGERVSSGVYFYQLRAGRYVSVRKMISKL